MKSNVSIVGAGPGAADLLTLRAASLLRAAGVVLHDDLVPQEVLDLVPASAEIVNVGKRCGRHGASQEQINALMVSYARQGANVVRLKSGPRSLDGWAKSWMRCAQPKFRLRLFPALPRP